MWTLNHYGDEGFVFLVIVAVVAGSGSASKAALVNIIPSQQSVAFPWSLQEGQAVPSNLTAKGGCLPSAHSVH